MDEGYDNVVEVVEGTAEREQLWAVVCDGSTTSYSSECKLLVSENGNNS